MNLWKWLRDILDAWRKPKPPEPTSDFAAVLLALHNGQRTIPLVIDQAIQAAAQEWAEYMARRDVMRHSDLPYAENVAAGADTTAWTAFSMWMGSPAHRLNAVSTAHRRVGFGRAESRTGVVYWCADYAG